MTDTVETFTPERLMPKEMTKEQWAALHRYRRIRHQEVRPEDPLTPDEIVEEQMKKDTPFGENFVFAVWDDGEIVSQCGYWLMNDKDPGWETNKHLLWGGGSVLATHRRRGIATMWARKILEVAKENDKTVLSTGTEEEIGHEFLRWLGAGEKQKGADNRLDLSEVDWDMVDEWVKDGRTKSPDTEMVFHFPRIPEEMLKDFSKSYSELLNTMPWDDLDHGDIVITPDTLKEEYERLDISKGRHYVAFTKEPSGKISGITDVATYPHQADRIEQWFTGVDPEERGRGLGKWLKAYMLQEMKERYPEARWVVTGNAHSNAPMLHINEKLGFKEHKSGSAYQMTAEELEKRLAEL
jgi:GNAT superfamily N-acetyltransferase